MLKRINPSKIRMCSTITDFLEDKITTTKKGSNTSNILQGSLKEVNGLCGKGIVPQVSEIKGLSKQDKEILNKKTENALKKFYDRVGNLPDEDFDGIKLKSSKTGSGTPGTRLSGDTVSDLKSSDPNLESFRTNPESSIPPLKTVQAQANPLPKLETAKATNNPDNSPSSLTYSEQFDDAVESLGKIVELSTECVNRISQEVKYGKEGKGGLVKECDIPKQEIDTSLQENQAKLQKCYTSYNECFDEASQILNKNIKACSLIEDYAQREECEKMALV